MNAMNLLNTYSMEKKKVEKLLIFYFFTKGVQWVGDVYS